MLLCVSYREGGAWMEVAIKTFYQDLAAPADSAVHQLCDTRVASALRPRVPPVAATAAAVAAGNGDAEVQNGSA